MSEDFDFSTDGEGEDSGDTEKFEPDPATIAFLDQEAAAFAEVADEFAEVYGFKHDCHCDEDYAAGRVGEVTECYAGMIVDALSTCARLNNENKQLKSMVTALMEMNTALMESSEGGTDERNQSESERGDGEIVRPDADIERFNDESSTD